MKQNRWNFVGLVLAIGVLAAAVSCGGDGGGGGGGSSNIAGNVSSVSTASSTSGRASWLVRLASEVVGFARKAYAQVVGVDDVEVFAGRGTDLTDEDGDFDVDAPTGDVTVRFRKDDCEAEVDLPDVADGSSIDLADVDFDCDTANPAEIAESFEAVVRNKPASPSGNLSVCVDLGSGFRNRVVKIAGAEFQGGTFESLAEEDRIAVSGVREGQGQPSALDADVVTILGANGGDPCSGDLLPTATATTIPGGTETPGPTNTPEPTATPTATETPE
jgi:hypothetical protein